MRLNELTPVLPLMLIVSLCLGCVIGSFLNVVVWRVPRGDSLVSPPSHCPNCGHLIRAWENIPVLSWLCLRGRCSGCHQPISIRYPLGELATGIGYAIVFWGCWRRNLPVAVLPGYFFVFGTLICVTQIDFRHQLIPDVITYSGLVAGLFLSLQYPESRLIFGEDLQARSSGTILVRHVFEVLSERGWNVLTSPILAAFVDYVTGVLTGAVILGSIAVPCRWLSRGSAHPLTVIGYGDVKFLAMLGGFLGADACLYIACTGAFAGMVYGIVSLIITRGRRGREVAYGPMLSVGCLLWMMIGSWWERVLEAIKS